jgi:glycosyltransferase involved in cell wall biosynthesis
MTPLRLLYVAYPLQPVSDASCGGAEQMLHLVESGMAARGHETHTAAQARSRVSGKLLVAADAPSTTDDAERLTAQMVERVLAYLREHRERGEPFDLVHDASGLFWRHAAELREPVLLTAHLPRDFYNDALRTLPPSVTVNCVSENQRRSFRDVPAVAATVPNGIPLERFSLGQQKHDYLLWLGRICEEKGAHTAIAVARATGMPLVVAGEVYPFSYHQQYFRSEVEPHIDGNLVRLVRSPDFAQKLDLLRHARALLVPSTAAETSSLVAMEAAACGTAVLAFASGALPEVVEHGVTGFVVRDQQEMAAVLSRIDEIAPADCRRIAERRFTAARVIAQYEELYWSVCAKTRGARSEGTAA